jgi:hypothetical protein
MDDILFMVFFWSIKIEVVETPIEERPPLTPKVNIALERPSFIG